jgi:Heavy metal binding domain
VINPHLKGSMSAMVFGLSLVQAGQAVNPQAPRSSAVSPAAPDSWTCPMHPDVLETHDGSCPICKMNLTRVRLDTIWTCPVHRIVADPNGGACPICGRALVQVIVAVSWTCTDRQDIEKLDRGTCPDGSPMIVKYAARPHGNHNPQHGGQFFMAADNWHHLEGAYPRAGVFRLYLYDDYSKPLPAQQLKTVTGRVVTHESFDSATRTTREIAAFPLVVAGGGAYLEARIGRSAFPSQVTVKVSFKQQTPEYRFDFTFSALSKDPERPALVRSAPKAPARARRADAAPRQAPDADVTTMPATEAADGAQASLPIPETVEGMLADLRVQNGQIRARIDDGQFGDIYVPAFQAKDLALALDAHIGQLMPDARSAAAAALATLVRTTWVLDAMGDLGDKARIASAQALFSSALAEVEAAFQTKP